MAAATAAAPSPPPTTLAALLAPHIAAKHPRQGPLPAAVFWDADNVRPPSGQRRAAVRLGLAALAAELSRAGCRVDACAAYGNAATLRGKDDDDDDAATDVAPRLVVTNPTKRQSADMALLSDLAAFVVASSASAADAAPLARPPAITCLVLLIADDAGYAATCAWAATANGAAIIACGASAARRGKYSPAAAPAPWRFHPVGRVPGAAAVVVPWLAPDDDDVDNDQAAWGRLDVGAAWIDPKGLFG